MSNKELNPSNYLNPNLDTNKDGVLSSSEQIPAVTALYQDDVNKSFNKGFEAMRVIRDIRLSCLTDPDKNNTELDVEGFVDFYTFAHNEDIKSARDSMQQNGIKVDEITSGDFCKGILGVQSPDKSQERK